MGVMEENEWMNGWMGYAKQIMGDLKCEKELRCVKSHLKDICKARPIWPGSDLECLEDEPGNCTFATRPGNKWLCKCPLRIYISKELGPAD